MKRKTRILALLSATIFVLAAACSVNTTEPPAATGGASTPVTESPASAANNGQFPLTVSHAFGEIVIESKPERVVTISWGNQDVPLALDVAPVGMSESNYGVLDGSRLLPWTNERLAELGVSNPTIFSDTDGLDFEAINAAKPDVILAAYSGITQEEYDTLSEIAPTIAYPVRPWQTLWRDQILKDAEGMGMEAEGAELISELEAKITETLEKYPRIKGKTAAFIYFSPTDLSTFSIYSPSDPRCAYLLDLGLIIPDSILTLAKDSDSFYLTISAENADLVSDLDIILTWGSVGEEGLVEALQADSLLGSIPAVKRGSIVMLDESPLAAAQTPSALSIPWAIDEYLSAIAAAAEKAE
ncbi:MAG: iron-siderophore ABC transporter substrate-binding protein [Oscillospiraceae bacterium]|jgi:iron complex transport system substrate-binding protein|nr:iron-siderophore ABC transporter substrate-binding protein [Oscillospiraceae bacterium]